MLEVPGSRIELHASGTAGDYRLREGDGEAMQVDGASLDAGVLSLRVDGDGHRFQVDVDGERVILHHGTGRLRFERLSPFRPAAGTDDAGDNRIRAPMPGRVVLVSAAPGDEVGLSLITRSSYDKSWRYECALMGKRFVCDNGALSGEFFARVSFKHIQGANPDEGPKEESWKEIVRQGMSVIDQAPGHRARARQGRGVVLDHLVRDHLVAPRRRLSRRGRIGVSLAAGTALLRGARRRRFVHRRGFHRFHGRCRASQSRRRRGAARNGNPIPTAFLRRTHRNRRPRNLVSGYFQRRLGGDGASLRSAAARRGDPPRDAAEKRTVSLGGFGIRPRAPT